MAAKRPAIKPAKKALKRAPARRTKRDPVLDPLFAQTPKEEELVAASRAADAETAEVLANLEAVQTERSSWNKDKVNDKRYQALRRVATEVLLSGPRYFLDSHGVRMVAVRRQSEKLIVDEELFAAKMPELFEQVAPRKIDKELFKRAAMRGDIPAEIFLAVASFEPNAPFVDFIIANDT